MQDEVKVARQVGGVDDGDDDVGCPVQKTVTGDPLVVGDGVEGVGAGQVDELHLLAAQRAEARLRPTVMPG